MADITGKPGSLGTATPVVVGPQQPVAPAKPAAPAAAPVPTPAEKAAQRKADAAGKSPYTYKFGDREAAAQVIWKPEPHKPQSLEEQAKTRKFENLKQDISFKQARDINAFVDKKYIQNYKQLMQTKLTKKIGLENPLLSAGQDAEAMKALKEMKPAISNTNVQKIAPKKV